jgi:hypothetical protein
MSPASTLTAVVSADEPSRPDTATGVELFVVELLPNCPEEFQPQHLTVPSAITAHELSNPRLTPTAVDESEFPSIPETETGTELSVVELLPKLP